MSASAMIFGGGVLRTNASVCRPTSTLFGMAGLNSRPWWNRADFGWVKELEAETSAIRDEFTALRAERPESDYQLQEGEKKLHSGRWDWLNLMTKGRFSADVAARCPRTTDALSRVPGLMSSVPVSYAFFSVLGGGASIAPHHGPTNVRLRCHLPLIVPEGGSDAKQCGIRVGDETRPWRVGEAMLFDDTYEHETWNKAGGEDEERVVLLFDLWHPDLTEEERGAIVRMFEQGGGPPRGGK